VANDTHLLTDLRLELRHSELRPVYAVADGRAFLSRPPGSVEDLAVIAGRDNLGQAIFLRLLTERGELTALGHPDYGSRLPELVGRENTANTRNLVKLFILEALAQEPRIARVLKVEVEPAPGTRDRVNVRLAVQPAGPTAVLDLGPFSLEL
jgi:phage baseplate assembly protein W